MEGEGANTQAQHAWRRGRGISEDGGGGGGRSFLREEGGRPLGNQISTSLLEGAGGGCRLGWRWGANAVDRDKTNVVACSARWGGEEGGISRPKVSRCFLSTWARKLVPLSCKHCRTSVQKGIDGALQIRICISSLVICSALHVSGTRIRSHRMDDISALATWLLLYLIKGRGRMHFAFPSFRN